MEQLIFSLTEDNLPAPDLDITELGIGAIVTQVSQYEITGQFRQSIQRTGGCVKPIIVAQTDDPGEYEILDGRRRFRAIVELGFENIAVRAYSKSLGRVARAALALILNEHRGKNPLSEYEAICELLENGYTPKQIAQSLNIGISTIKKRLELQKLLPQLMQAFRAGKVKATTAQQIAKLTKKRQKMLLPVLRDNEKLIGRDVVEIKERIRAQTVQKFPEFAEIGGFQEPEEKHEIDREALAHHLLLARTSDTTEGANSQLELALALLGINFNEL